jgi:hypothetical protein
MFTFVSIVSFILIVLASAQDTRIFGFASLRSGVGRVGAGL